MTNPVEMLPPEQAALITRFFMTFARFEYALKAVGWWIADVRGGAQPDWNRVAQELGNAPENQRRAVIDAGRLLLSDPPKKQMIINGQIDWHPAEPNNGEISRFLVYLRRVRNNLFHGGKCLPAPLLRPRSTDLVRNAQAAIDMLLTLPHFEPVRRVFDEYTDEEW